MANVVGIVAALLALAGGVFAALLLTTNEFVEVFVQEPNDKLSCKIGYLGVYEAGFDAGCLEETTLLESGLGSKSDVTNKLSQTIEPFESDTLDFKLLFVAQAEFYTEFSVLETLGLGAAPEFENCEQYVGKLAEEPSKYSANAGDISLGVFGAFVDGFSSLIFTNTFADEDGVSALLAGLSQTAGNVVAGSGAIPSGTLVGGSSPFTVSSYLAVASGVAANTNFSSAAPTIKKFIEYSVETFLPNAALIDAGIGAINASGVRLDYVFNVLYNDDFNVTEAVSADQVGAMCGALNVTGSLSSPCSLRDLAFDITAPSAGFAGPAQAFVDEGVGLASSEEGIEKAALLKQGWNGLQLFIAIHSFNLYFGLLGSADASIIDSATSVAAVIPKQRASVAIETLPAKWTDEYTVCNLMNTALKLNISAPCSMEKFILSSSAGDVSAAAPLSSLVEGQSKAAEVANNLAPEKLGSIESFSGLFDSCFNLFLGGQLKATGKNVTASLANTRDFFGPSLCYSQFPQIIIATQYQDAELLENQGADFFAAVEKKCDDDTLDSEAISNAQTMGPAGTALLFVGAVAGIVTIVKPNKILAVVSAVLCLAGVGLLVGALLGVYNAPVYSAVGGDTDPYDVKYVSGVTVTYGIVAMALGGLAGVLFIVSIFTNKGGDNVLEADNKLKPASL